jgi:hypothetical protein
MDGREAHLAGGEQKREAEADHPEDQESAECSFDEETAKTLRAGQLARDRWMQKARAHVESL